MKTKSIFQSKTFWLNLIVGIITILGFINPELLKAIGIDNITQFMTITGPITALLNVVLRMFTTKQIRIKKPINEITNKL